MTKGKKILLALLIAPIVLLLLIQLVPFGRDHTNPPVSAEPTWDSPRTRELASRACFDCHSNETTWPWYANVAPVSWLVAHDVDEGRSKLNFSEWDKPQREWHEAAEEVEDGEMPMAIYVLLHSEASLTDDETRELIDGLGKLNPPAGGKQDKHSDRRKHRDDDDDDDDH